MPALAEVHLVSDPDDLCHPLRSPMISLSDHLAGLCESVEATTLRAAQRIRLEMRNDPIHEVGHRPGFEPDPQSRTDGERDAEASFALRQAGHVPGVQPDCCTIGVPVP